MDTLALVITVIFSSATLMALFLLIHLLFPKRMERIRGAAHKQGSRAFWLGLVNTLFAAALTLGLLTLGDQSGIFFLPAFAVISVYAVGLFLGQSALARLIGSRLLPAKNSHLQVLGGSLVIIFASLTPFIGWFLLFPYLGFRGFGAALLSLTKSGAEAHITDKTER